MYHPLFIPICYRIATMSKINSSLYQVIGSNQPVLVTGTGQNGDHTIQLKNNKSDFLTIPVQHAGKGSETVLFPSTLPVSGIYNAITGSDTLARLAFNNSRIESELSFLPDTLVSKRLRNAGWNIPMNNNSQILNDSRELAARIATLKVWYYFLLLALMALLAESLVMNNKK
jgi:hypothetical protein